MITIDIDKAQSGNVLIGRQGEHDFSRIHFVMGQWAVQYPTGSVSVVYERPDGETYPVVTEGRASGVVWQPSLADLSVAGAGRLECRITTETGLGKSATVPVSVAPAIGAVGAVPIAPIPDWTYTVADNAHRAEKAATEAEATAAAVGETLEAALQQAKDSGEFNGPRGEQGEQGIPGEPGAVVSETEPAPYSDGTHPLWFYPQGEGITAETLGADPLGAADAALTEARFYTDGEIQKHKLPKPLPYDYMPSGYLNWQDLRDKPFETVDVYEGVLEHQTITFPESGEAFAIACVETSAVTAPERDDGLYVAVNPFLKEDGSALIPPGVAEMSYRVLLDGTAYECQCQMVTMSSGESYPALGNPALVGAEGQGEEPFCLLWLTDETVLFGVPDGAEHTFALELMIPAGCLMEKPVVGSFPAAVGPGHRVYFDGVCYECECIPLMGELHWMGNGSLVGIPWAVGEEPFGLLWFGSSWLMAAESAGEHTLSVEVAAAKTSRICQQSLPFYNQRRKKVVAQETVTTKTLGSGQNRSDMLSYAALGHSFVIGREYLITYDGKEYLCTCYGYNGRVNNPSLGNSMLGGAEEDVQGKGEPFLLTKLVNYWIHYTKEPGEHHSVIETWEEVPVPLEEKYIPTLDSLMLRSAGGSTFRLTVAEDGTLSAVREGENI